MKVKNRSKFFEILTIVIPIVLFLWALLFAVHIPLYIDEPAYSTYWSRFLINGGFRQSYYPYCDENFLLRPPFLLIPAAFTLSAFSELFGENFYTYRIVPLLCWLVILSILYVNGRRHNDQSFWPLLLVFLVGPTLYSLVFLRAEIIILTFSVVLYFWGSKECLQNKVNLTLLGVVLIIFAYSTIIYMHAKTLYLLPAVTIAVIMRTKIIKPISTRITVRLLGISLIIAQTISAVCLLWSKHISCHAFPKIEKAMSSQAINPLQLFSNPPAFFKNFDNEYINYLWSATSRQVSYENTHIIGRFLPNVEASPDFLLIVRLLVLCVLILILIMVLKKLFKIATAKNVKGLKWNAWLIFLIALGLIGPYILNLSRFFYDVSFLVGSIVLVACLSSPIYKNTSVFKSIFINKLKEILIPCFFIVFGLFGRAMNNKFYDIPLLGGYRGRDSLVLFSDFGPLESYGVILRNRIAEMGISSQEPLIVDDITYNMLFKHSVLINVATINGFDPNNPSLIAKLLIKRKIKYMATGCGPFPPGFKSGVHTKIIYIMKISPTLSPSPVTNNICVVKLSYSKTIKQN